MQNPELNREPPPNSFNFGAELPSTIENVEPVESQFIAALTAAGYDSKNVIPDLALAFREALINGMHHGNNFDPGKKVRYAVEVTPQKVKFTVEDQGPGFDPAQIPDPTAGEGLLKGSGRGILMMRAYGQVDYNAKGNAVTFEYPKSFEQPKNKN